MRRRRLTLLLIAAFCLGGSSAELAVRAARSISKRNDVGSAGHLVEVTLRTSEGEIIASPRVIAPPGKPARLLLRDPRNPSSAVLLMKVEATREPGGDVGLAYELAVPARDLDASGKVSLEPGEEARLDLRRDDVEATVLAIPVPSSAFDAYLEAEAQAPDSI